MQSAQRRVVRLLLQARWRPAADCANTFAPAAATASAHTFAWSPLHASSAAPSCLLPAAASPCLQRPFTTSAGVHDAARERRLLAAQLRAKRAAERRAAAADAPPTGGAPPPATTTGASSSTALVEGAPLAPAEFELPNEAAVSRMLNHPALIITRWVSAKGQVCSRSSRQAGDAACGHDDACFAAAKRLSRARLTAHPTPPPVACRDVEWGTVILGFEQATKYTVYDENGNVGCGGGCLEPGGRGVDKRAVQFVAAGGCSGPLLCHLEATPPAFPSPSCCVRFARSLHPFKTEQRQVVALMAEDTTSFANAVARQVLRTRRPFSTTVFSPDGARMCFVLAGEGRGPGLSFSWGHVGDNRTALTSQTERASEPPPSSSAPPHPPLQPPNQTKPNTNQAPRSSSRPAAPSTWSAAACRCWAPTTRW